MIGLRSQAMEIVFISSVAVITPQPAESRKLFMDALQLPLHPASPGDEYHFTDQVDGCKHFGVWPLAQAAQACFGTVEWPADLPVPQLSIEFDLANEAAVGQATQELEARGYTLLHAARTEPWGQVVARLQTLEGAIVGVGCPMAALAGGLMSSTWASHKTSALPTHGRRMVQA